MDYNDIKSRLSRTLLSLDARFDDDIDKYIRHENWPNGQGVSIYFGSDNEAEILNKIFIILHNLSSLKDHIKNSLIRNHVNPQVVESEIENSLHLKILIDIVNQEKHGAPLRQPRSHRGPVIRYPTIGYFPFVKSRSSNNENGADHGCMMINALIKDDGENLIFSLDELVETCFAKWDTLIKAYNLI